MRVSPGFAGPILVIAATILLHGRALADEEIIASPSARDSRASLAKRTHNKASLPAGIDATDEVAALDGIRIALTEVGDGGTYVWHRRDGLLSGLAQPTTSFKDSVGRPCRNVTVMLNTYGRSSRIDGTACRDASGRWDLVG